MTSLLPTALLLHLVPAFVLAAGTLAPPVAPHGQATAPDEVAALVESIARTRDDSDPADIERLASHPTRDAALGLVGLYDRMATTYMRLEIVRALGRYDGVSGAEQPALQKLMDVATTASSRMLRMEALEALGRGASLGHSFLARIVDSPADDEVRVHALRLHVAHTLEADEKWYRRVFEGGGASEEKHDRTRARRSRDDSPAERQLEVHSLPELREVAFGALAAGMSPRALLEASEDEAPNVRRAALTELRARDPKLAARRADEVFGRADEKASNRVLAAEILAQVRGSRIAGEFIEVGLKFATPEELRVALAELLQGLRDPAVDKRLVKLVGKTRARPHESIFVLRAVRGAQDPKLTARILKELDARELEVRVAAIETLGQRGDTEAIPALEALVTSTNETDLLVALLQALSLLHADDPGWRETLLEHAASDDSALRNAALTCLGGKAQNLEVLARALEDEHWTTRAIALEGLTRIGSKEIVPLLIARLAQEDGRLRQDIGDVLFNLTGMPFPPEHRKWTAWWEREGPEFEVLLPEQLEERRAAAEERRLRMVTRVQFLGVQIVSHRVIFLIDTSGSMDEPLRTRFVGDNAGEARIEVARRELKSAVDDLDAATLFNIITFGSGVERWLDEGVATSDRKSREDAGVWIDRLGALGGTNLHGGLKAAFEDPDVDTIFVLSDGEPSVGELTDPYAIRTLVQRWNQQRGVVIHAMAIGTTLEVLAWLAQDSGGTYVEFR